MYGPDVAISRARAENVFRDCSKALDRLAPFPGKAVAHVSPLTPVEDVEATITSTNHNLAAPLQKQGQTTDDCSFHLGQLCKNHLALVISALRAPQGLYQNTKEEFDEILIC